MRSLFRLLDWLFIQTFQAA
uniref:Uncharacterized protein n=1 Tax=Anguilla anguilla TaxID=7936 RepID=A0A0E9RJD8_ANGAN